MSYVIEVTQQDGEKSFVEDVSDFDLTGDINKAETFTEEDARSEIFNLINEDRSEPGSYRMDGCTYAIRKTFITLGEPEEVGIAKSGLVIRSGHRRFLAVDELSCVEEMIGDFPFDQYEHAKTFDSYQSAEECIAEIRASMRWDITLYIDNIGGRTAPVESISADFMKGVE